MNDPYQILGLAPDSDDEAIRRRYLELVRQYTPEHAPEKFAAVRAAYDELRDPHARLNNRLFQPGKAESIDALLEELQCGSPRRRVSLESMLATIKKP